MRQTRTLAFATLFCGLGDHFVYAPDGLGSQVMYLNLGGLDNATSPGASHGIGIAVPADR
jgi:hypothetical protein